MLSNSRIRVGAALVFSIVVHAMLVGHFFRDESMPVAGMPRQKVEIQLVARRAVAVKPVVAPAKAAQKNEQLRPVLPPQRPVEVAVREIPALSLPTPPLVPELADKAEDNAPVKQEPVAETAVPARPTMIMARPRYRDNPPPEYPARAKRRHLQGTVILEVAVSRDGKVEQLRINESSGHKILDRAALQAVKNWLFEPGRRGADRVAMQVLVPVRFSFR